jgi:alpha/beta superfamily hydrolase
VTDSIKTFFINGPAGRLEALLNQGQPDATYAALVCHPHPLFGGTVHNKVVYHAMKTLHGFGFPVLRFNFRGAGLSEGQHDHGRGEVEDVRTALNWLNAEFHLPMIFCGFSFGAATGLRAACPDDRVAGLIALGLPVAVEGRAYTYPFLDTCAKPKLLISGSRDQFSTQESLRQAYELAAGPKQLVFVEGGDHFFEGHLSEMQSAIHSWVKKVFQTGTQAEAI